MIEELNHRIARERIVMTAAPDSQFVYDAERKAAYKALCARAHDGDKAARKILTHIDMCITPQCDSKFPEPWRRYTPLAVAVKSPKPCPVCEGKGERVNQGSPKTFYIECTNEKCLVTGPIAGHGTCVAAWDAMPRRLVLDPPDAQNLFSIANYLNDVAYELTCLLRTEDLRASSTPAPTGPGSAAKIKELHASLGSCIDKRAGVSDVPRPAPSAADYFSCSQCGRALIPVDSGPPSPGSFRKMVCPQCSGDGELHSPSAAEIPDPCPKCRGEMYICEPDLSSFLMQCRNDKCPFEWPPQGPKSYRRFLSKGAVLEAWKEAYALIA